MQYCQNTDLMTPPKALTFTRPQKYFLVMMSGRYFCHPRVIQEKIFFAEFINISKLNFRFVDVSTVQVWHLQESLKRYWMN